MTTGSLCFTEILKSWKSCSSNSEASHTADSTSASGVALPYLASRRGSSEPALTPIRMDTPASLAAWAIAFTWSSKRRMLPGFTRTAAQPASIAANTYFGWKWMSAITGICDLRAIAGSASASSWLGQATRTMSQPVAVSSAICCRVALMSVVGVVVIDCTLIGASPPTSTLPTRILREGRRGASTGGGAAGMPMETLTSGPLGVVSPASDVVGCSCLQYRPPRAMRVHGPIGGSRPWPALLAPVSRPGRPARQPARSAADPDRVDDVGVHEQDGHGDQHAAHGVGDRQQPGDIEGAGVRAAAQPGDGPPSPLVQRPGDVPAVQREQRDQVEHEQRQVERRQQGQQERDPRAGPLDERDVLAAGDLTRDPGDADDADGAVGVALAVSERGLGDADHLLRDAQHHAGGLRQPVPDHAGHLGERLANQAGQRREAEEADPLGAGCAVRGQHRPAVGAHDRPRSERDRRGQGERLPVALDGELHGAPASRPDGAAGLLPAGDLLAVEGD